MGTSKSVLTKDVEHCFLCGRFGPEDMHHCISGRGRRQIADKYGLIVPLCRLCHSRLHDNGEGDQELKKYAQTYYEKHIGTREQFRQDFGKSWL